MTTTAVVASAIVDGQMDWSALMSLRMDLTCRSATMLAATEAVLSAPWQGPSSAIANNNFYAFYTKGNF